MNLSKANCARQHVTCKNLDKFAESRDVNARGNQPGKNEERKVTEKKLRRNTMATSR